MLLICFTLADRFPCFRTSSILFIFVPLPHVTILLSLHLLLSLCIFTDPDVKQFLLLRETVISYSQAKALCILGIKPISKIPIEVGNILIGNDAAKESGTGTEVIDGPLGQNEVLSSEIKKSSSGTIPSS